MLNDNKKRQISASSQGSSPKKVRFSPRDNQTKVFVKGSIPSPGSPALPRSVIGPATEDVESDDILSDLDEILFEPTKLPDNPDRHLLNILREHPQPLSLSQISDLFHVVQSHTEEFARTWYGRSNNGNVQEVVKNMLQFPIHDLELKYPALYLTTVNVLDASTTDGASHGWLKFFAHPDYRQYLVYAILGEWFTQRIFKDTAFGLPPTKQQKMHEDADTAYLYFDSFVRAKERSKLVAQFVNAESTESTTEWLEREASKLADELLTVLSPMHSCTSVADQQGRPQNKLGEIQRKQMRHSLIDLISQCAALNWSIVRSGEDGTVIRIADRLENGKRFWPTAPMHCVNQDTMDRIPDASEQNAIPVVKMTCWARIEAFVPHGLDMIQMAQIEEHARKEHDLDAVDQLTQEGRAINRKVLDKAHDKFCWECSDAKKAWDILPEELWPTEHRNQRKMESHMRNAELRAKLEHKRARQQEQGDGGGDPDDSDAGPGQSEHSESDSSSSSDTTNDGMYRLASAERNGVQGDGQPLRGSWITYYSCLNPHQVYCEWAKAESDYQEELKLRTGLDCKEPIRRYNGLRATVRRARANLPPLPRSIAQSEDFVMRLWNFYAGNNLKIEWGAFVLLVIYGLTKARVFSFAGEISSAAIHLALCAATQVLAGVQHLTNLVQSATPLRSIIEELQLLHVEMQGFLGRLQGALGYKWYRFIVAVNNAIPRPNITEIEQAIRETSAEGSSSALSVFGRARTGLSYMTEAAKSDLAQLLAAVTTTATIAASATTSTGATVSVTSDSTLGTTGRGRGLVDRIWRNLPIGPEPRDIQTVTPLASVSTSSATAASENLVKYMEENLPWIPSPSDVEVQLGNLDGTPIATPMSTLESISSTTLHDVVQTSVPTPLSTTNNIHQEAGAWWIPSWLGANPKPNHTISPTVSTTATPTGTADEDEISRIPLSEHYPSEWNKYHSRVQTRNNRISTASSKYFERVPAKTSKLSEARARKTRASAMTTKVPSTSTPTSMFTSNSMSMSAATSPVAQPRVYINDKYRSAYDMLNRVKHSAASAVDEKLSKVESATSPASAPAAPTDVASKIDAKFSEMAEDGIESVSTMRGMRTLTVRPPGETLVVEIARPGREELRRRWFNRIPH